MARFASVRHHGWLTQAAWTNIMWCHGQLGTLGTKITDGLTLCFIWIGEFVFLNKLCLWQELEYPIPIGPKTFFFFTRGVLHNLIYIKVRLF